MNRSIRLVLALLPMVIYAGCSTAAHAQSVSPSVREGYLDAGGGVRLFYRTIGTGRDTLVVIHGGPGFNLNYLAADLEPLAPRHTVIFYDQRGAGRSSLVSDSAGLDAQRFAEDLEAVRRYFRLGRLSMMGHSWGAAVAALYAVRYPERVGRILIVDGIPVRRAEFDQTFAALDANRNATTRRRMQELMKARLANPADANVCRAYYTLWFQPFYRDAAAARRDKGDFCGGTTEARRNKMANVDRFTVSSLGNWDWRASLRRVSAPVLVIHGTLDPLPVTSARNWAASFPNSRLLLVDGVGHFPYVEAPEQFFPAVDAFLRGGWPAGAQSIGAVDAIRDTTSVVGMFKDTAPARIFVAEGREFRLQTAAQRQAYRALVRSERRLWEANKPRDYQFLLRVDCFCPGTRGWQVMDVRGGQPLRAFDRNGKPAPITDWNTLSIDALYDNLEQTADRNAVTRIAFDQRWHFPAYVSTSYLPGPDAWSIYEVRAFRPR